METRASESVICSGSDLNQRTIDENESWNSLQSTVLAGHLEDKTGTGAELSATDDKNLHSSSFLSEDETIGLLDMNLDAISEDEVFYDCSQLTPERNFPPSSLAKEASRDKLLLDMPSSSFGRSGSLTSDSGMYEEWTGALLAHQVADAFGDLHDQHAQSTPKVTAAADSTTSPLSSPNFGSYSPWNSAGSPSPTQRAQIRPTFCATRGSFRSPQRILLRSPSSKINCLVEKYISSRSPTLMNGTCKVKEIKKLFENCSRAQKSSQQPPQKIPPLAQPQSSLHKLPSGRPRKPTPLPRVATLKLSNSSKDSVSTSHCNNSSSSSSSTRSRVQYRKTPAASKGPIHYMREICKLQKSKAWDPSSVLHPNSLGPFRSSSCSDCPVFSYDSLMSAASRDNRSRSTSDISPPKLNPRWVTLRKPPQQPTLRAGRKTSSPRLKTGKKTPSPKPKKVSAIMGRKSLGFVSSPIKPVWKLRKMFSPSQKSGGTTIARSLARSANKPPKIVISEV